MKLPGYLDLHLMAVSITLQTGRGMMVLNLLTPYLPFHLDPLNTVCRIHCKASFSAQRLTNLYAHMWFLN